MNEPICAVCGETKVNTLFVFNYGVCLCERCMETAAHCFIKDNTERKLKNGTGNIKSTVRVGYRDKEDDEKKNLEKEYEDLKDRARTEYEATNELKDKIREELAAEIKEAVKKKREEDAKKMAEATAKGFEEIGKAIFIETTYHPELYNGKKMLDDAKEQIHHYKVMYRNRLEKFANLMKDHKKLMEDYNKLSKERNSVSVKLIDAQLDANQFRRRCDELHEQLRGCVKRANGGILAASAVSLIVGLILGYLVR